MNKQQKSFLRNAILLTLALALVVLFMESWGAAQIIVTALVALLAAGQWALFIYIRKQ